ncbi:MAG TPA: D-sedoheptulose 7-phosphate isomerase [Desulfomonilia bacterium]|nr:D-sedoheptulose 7-phosphate isomerase [Desulfomonilia bacterium]
MPLAPELARAARMMVECIEAGGKIMFAGNGGSAADAQHLAAELVNRFKKERGPLAGLALTTDTSVITAIGNDYSFDDIFAKQIKALGRAGDLFVGISTSGDSQNVIQAIKTARDMGIATIGIMGQGGKIKELADCALTVPSSNTPRIQEVHILIGHILCELIEDAFI